MSNFITEIKRINSDQLIYALSKISIQMYKDDMSCTKLFPIYLNQYGVCRKRDVLLTAWDIPSIEYYSIINSSDHRNGCNINTLPMLFNLHRGYVDSQEGEHIKNHYEGYDVFKILMGMTSEQFQFQNIYLTFEKLNRTYHILVAAKNYEHRNELDVNMAVQSIFDFSPEDYLALLLMTFWLCSLHPDPLTAPEEFYRKKDLTIFTKENLTKLIKYYSCTYYDLRNSPLKKQLLYSKPFINTKRRDWYLSSSIYMVAFLLGNGLYWLVRDFYKKDGQKFPNAFGLLFEDYIKELAETYCTSTNWQVIPKGKQKGADYLFKFDSLQIIVESKSSLIRLDVKQQIPNLDAANKFLDSTIRESYEQLNNSYEQYKNQVNTPTIKVILLYDEFSNTAIIEQAMPEIFQKDSNCFILTIRDLEILLYLHKNDTVKFDLLVEEIIKSASSVGERTNFGAILDKLSAFENKHINTNLNYVKPILEHFSNNLK